MMRPVSGLMYCSPGHGLSRQETRTIVLVIVRIVQLDFGTAQGTKVTVLLDDQDDACR
jgi:hypothetical protein